MAVTVSVSPVPPGADHPGRDRSPVPRSAPPNATTHNPTAYGPQDAHEAHSKPNDHVTPLTPAQEATLLPLDVQAQVTVDGDCLIWTGPTNTRHQYAASNDGRLIHRQLWVRVGWPLSADRWLVRWSCRNPKCVRPSHLRAVGFSEWHREFRSRR